VSGTTRLEMLTRDANSLRAHARECLDTARKIPQPQASSLRRLAKHSLALARRMENRKPREFLAASLQPGGAGSGLFPFVGREDAKADFEATELGGRLDF
jgi:hypothetical protein